MKSGPIEPHKVKVANLMQSENWPYKREDKKTGHENSTNPTDSQKSK